MLRLIILIIVIYLLYRLIKGMFGTKKAMPKKGPTAVIDEMVQDPYCKTYIPRREAVRRVLGGKEILFCSEECGDKYEAMIEGKEQE